MAKRIVGMLLMWTLLAALVAGCVRALPSASQASAIVMAGDKPVVVVYLRSGCSFCQESRDFFAARGIAVLERNVLVDRSALVEMLEIHVRNFPDEEPLVPLIVIGERVVRGFDQQEIEKALAAAWPMSAAGSKP